MLPSLRYIFIFIYAVMQCHQCFFFFLFSLPLFFIVSFPPVTYQSINVYTISCWKHLWWWCPLMHIIMQIYTFSSWYYIKQKIIRFKKKCNSNLNSNSKKYVILLRWVIITYKWNAPARGPSLIGGGTFRRAPPLLPSFILCAILRDRKEKGEEKRSELTANKR